MISFGALLVGFALFLLWFYPSRMEDMAKRLETSRGRSVAGALAKAAASALSFNDELAVSELLSAMQSDPEARFAEVKRADGTTLAAWKVDKDKRWPKLDGEQQWLEGDTLVVATPIVGSLGGQGYLILGLSRQAFLEEVRTIKNVTVAAALAVLILGALVSSIMGRALSQPAQILTSLTRKVVSERDLRVVIPPLSRDEIGDLGRTFNLLLDSQRSILGALASSLDEHERLSDTIAMVGARV
jgi:methyl-accepting chemotaxis protein